jgi:integrase
MNRLLQVLRRAFKLAEEWGRTDKVLPRVRMLPGENRRERVLTVEEDAAYLQAAQGVGDGIVAAYRKALEGIRAVDRGEQPIEPADPYLLRDVATLLLDCALRPDEAFRLRWEQVRDGAVHIQTGKTANARREVPLSERAEALLAARRAAAMSEEWVFPSQTMSGHVEHFTLKKRHHEAEKLAKVAPFVFYTFRHTCLTRWSSTIDPYTLAYLAGHSDFATTKRYVHPRLEVVRAMVQKAHEAQGGHKNGHNGKIEAVSNAA